MRISDVSSDVCSSDRDALVQVAGDRAGRGERRGRGAATGAEAGALVHERGVGDAPAVVQTAADPLVGHPNVGHEDLVEHGPPGTLLESTEALRVGQNFVSSVSLRWWPYH